MNPSLPDDRRILQRKVKKIRRISFWPFLQPRLLCLNYFLESDHRKSIFQQNKSAEQVWIFFIFAHCNCAFSQINRASFSNKKMTDTFFAISEVSSRQRLRANGHLRNIPQQSYVFVQFTSFKFIQNYLLILSPLRSNRLDISIYA